MSALRCAHGQNVRQSASESVALPPANLVVVPYLGGLVLPLAGRFVGIEPEINQARAAPCAAPWEPPHERAIAQPPSGM